MSVFFLFLLKKVQSLFILSGKNFGMRSETEEPKTKNRFLVQSANILFCSHEALFTLF